MLNESVAFGSDNYNRLFDLHSVSLHELANRGGQIGPRRIRVHAWLEKNGYALVRASEIGSSQTGRVSRVALTDLVTATDTYSLAHLEIQYSGSVDRLLDTVGENEADWIRNIYPGLDRLDEEQLHFATACRSVTGICDGFR